MDHNQERRRHFHRGRRGPDRRGQERRTPPPQDQSSGRDQVDVEQIMRDIRARIVQRSGIELSPQQIQDLAARRLESILDPRSIKPALLDELRKGAAPKATPPAPETPEFSYSFEDTTLYESHRGALRLIRRILSPILRLFLNPNPLIRALNTQARINAETLRREADRDRRQAEWNALHYEILQRLVTEISRVTIELQSQTLRIESLAAKVDFNERRVRGLEGTMQQPRHSGRPPETVSTTPPPPASAPTETQGAPPAAVDGQPSEGVRRRRRRRRGRRGSGAPELNAGSVGASPTGPAPQVHGEAENTDASGASPIGLAKEDDADVEEYDNGGDEEMSVAAAPSEPAPVTPEPPRAEAPASESPTPEPFTPPPATDRSEPE